jgi:hypothetical protein
MLGNIQKLAKNKSRENRPRRKGLKNIGSHNVGVSKVVDTYAT